MAEEINIELNDSVKACDVSKVEELLLGKADPNFQFDKELGSSTVLHTAVTSGSTEIVHLLLQYGANPNLEDNMKCTPIFTVYHAINKTDVIQLLLEYGADINHKNKIGITALSCIIESNALPYEKLSPLIDQITDVKQKSFLGGNLLHTVMDLHPDEDNTKLNERNHFCYNYLQKLWEKGCTLINEKDDDGDTPLHAAASVACYNSVQYFIEKGANVNDKNNEGQTALHYLAENIESEGFSNSLELLLESGANINEKDINGKTPLQYSVSSGKADNSSIKALVLRGALTDATDSFGRNMIHSAVVSDDKENSTVCIEVLTEVGVNLNGSDIFGLTPLHLAVTTKNVQIVEKLLVLGGEVTKVSKTGESVLHRASARYMIGPTLIDWCLKNNIDLNVCDNFGSTPLHWAIWFREQVVIKSLLENGADINVRDSAGNTPMELSEILKYDHFRFLVEQVQLPSNLCMTLNGVQVEFHGTDAFEECPVLCYVDKTDGTTDLVPWMEHLQVHKMALKKFVTTILESPDMGLYYDIRENEIIPVLIERVINEMAEYVSRSCPLLACNICLAGSRYEKTKVNIPNEFDYLFSLVSFSDVFIPVESDFRSSEFIMLKLKDEEKRGHFSQFLDSDGYLDGRKINCALYSFVNKGLLKLFQEKTDIDLGSLYIADLLNSSSGNLSDLRFYWVGPTMKFVTISVDVVPEVVVTNWVPKEIHTESSLLNRVQGRSSVSVVMKMPDPNFIPNNTKYLRISVADWEQAIIRSLPCAVTKGYIIVKALLDSFYFPVLIDNDNEDIEREFLNTYKLKTCFLHELEMAELAGDTTLSITELCASRDVSLDWANRIITHLEQSIKDQMLPSFFYPARNLLLFEGSAVMYSVEEYTALVTCLRELLKNGSCK